MKPALVLLPLLLFGRPAAGQDEATTLLEGCRRAGAIVRAVVVGAGDPAPEWRRVEFARIEPLAGEIAERFALLEPAGACCGRSLFALQPGQQCLLFLQRRGPAWHPFGGARGVLADEPGVAAHVRALLGAADDRARARLLADGLRAPEPRIAADAAHALASLPGLELEPPGRIAVAAALAEAIGSGRTTAAPLAAAAVRAGGAGALDTMVQLYVETPHGDRAALLRSALRRADPRAVAGRLPALLGGSADREVRAAELLAELPAEDAAGPLRDLLGAASHPRAQLAAAEALLRHGVHPASLRGRLPPPVLELAERRHEGPARLRNLPHGGR
ncbi:MAG: hypothetical protein FJ265_05480 [Planctomycetes bacterium]|nr:hypothetical protein [Planctomycetota bacterium]